MTKKRVYKRLTIENRMDIQAAIHDGKTISKISRMLGVLNPPSQGSLTAR